MWLFALVSHALAGGVRPPAFEPVDVTVRTTATQFCAPSGRRVTVLPDGHQDLVSVSTVVGTGAAGDPAGGGGAHDLVQRLSYRARLPTGVTVVERLAELGATIFFSQDLDTTSVVTLAHSSVLPEILAVELARLSDPLAGITPKVFEAERNARAVRLDEVSRRDLLPLARYLHDAFQDPPYAQLGVATPSTLRSLDLEALRAAASTAYRPDRTTIVVRGDVDPGVVGLALADRAPAGSPEVACDFLADPPDTPRTRAGADAMVSIEAPVAERTLLLGWVLPPAYLGNDLIMDQAVEALTGAISRGVGSTTAQRHKFQPSCGRLPGGRASLAICSLRVPDGTSARSVERRAISHLGDIYAVDASFDTERTSRFLVGSLNLLPMQMERLVAGAPVAVFEHATGDWDYVARAVEQIRAFDGGRIVSLAKTWLKADLAHTVLLYPPGTSGDPDAGAAVPDKETDAASDAIALDEPDAAPVDAPIGLMDESLALLQDPKLGRPRWLEETVVTTLENGLRIVVVPWDSAPLMRAALVLEGGDSSEPFYGLDAFTELMVDSRGTAPFGSTTLTLNDAALRVGGRWDVETTHDAQVYRLRVGAGQLDAAVYLMRRRIDGLDLDLGVGERDAQSVTLSRRIDWYGDDPNQARWWALRAWRVQLWGPAASGRQDAFRGGVVGLPGGSAQRHEEWYHAQLRPDRATLYIVGDVDPAEAERIVRARMEDWKRPKAPVPPPSAKAPAPVPEPRVYVADAPESRVATVAAGCPVAPSNRAVRQVGAVLLDEAVDRLTLDAAIAGPGGADLSDVIDGAARASLSVTVAPERAAAALRAIDALFVELSAPLPIERVQRAKARVLRAQVTHWVTGDDLLADLVVLGGPKGDLAPFRSMGEELRAVGPDDVAALFRSCPAHLVGLVIGPGMTRADLGSAVVVDREAEYHALRNRKASEVTPAPDLARW